MNCEARILDDENMFALAYCNRWKDHAGYHTAVLTLCKDEKPRVTTTVWVKWS